MKENKTKTIKKVSKIQPENDWQDKHNIQIEMDVTVTRITSLSELKTNKYSLERDLEDSKKRVLEIESKIKDLDALIARINIDILQN